MCNCGKNKRASSGTFTVELPGGLKVTKSSEAAAKAFSARHPGSKVIMPAAK